MKKFVIMIAVLAMSTVSSKALDLPFSLPAMPDLGNFSLTVGAASNQGVYGATATEQAEDDKGVKVDHTKKESGVFTDGFSSRFIELGIGEFLSVGYEMTPDSISTPVNTTRENNTREVSVSVDFNDYETTYVKLNMPFVAGLYVKAGSVSTDLDIKETMGSGSTYANRSTSGDTYGVGYSKNIGDTGLALRIEGMYLELDNVKTDNGIASGTTIGTTAVARDGTSTSRNEIEASHMEGLTAKVALTFTLGGNK